MHQTHHWQVLSGLNHMLLFSCTPTDSMRLAIIAPCALCLPTLLTHCTGTALSGFIPRFVTLIV